MNTEDNKDISIEYSFAYQRVSERLLALDKEFDNAEGRLRAASTANGKKPRGPWKVKDGDNKIINEVLKVDLNNEFIPTATFSKNEGTKALPQWNTYPWLPDRISIAFNNIQHGFVVLDVDSTNENTLKLVKSLLEDYNEKIIAYPTKNGAHLWFSIPEEVKEGSWWMKDRQTGFITKTGAGLVDYLMSGIINISLLSSKTGKIELMMDSDNFNEGELSKDFKELFDGFKTLDFSWDNINNLPELPAIAKPLFKSTKEELEDNLFKSGAGTNTNNFLTWAGKLAYKTELDEDVDYDLEVCLDWMNENITTAYHEDMDATIQSVQGYDNDFTPAPYREDGKLKKQRQAREKKEKKEIKRKEVIENIQSNVELSEKRVDWNMYFDMKDNQKLDIAEFLIDALDIRLLNGTTLVLRKGQKDIINSSNVGALIMKTRPGQAVDVPWAKKIMEVMVSILKLRIDVEGEVQYIAEYVKKPLWVDTKGNLIDPFDIFTADGKIKIQSRTDLMIENDVVPFDLKLDFTKLNNYDKESYNLLHKWIMDGVGNDVNKFNYFFRYYGYTLMVGNKFTRQIGFIGGVTGSGKSSLEEIISKTVVGQGKTGIANANLFDGRFGLQAIAAKARGVLDEGASAFKGNSEDLKRISGTTTTLVEPKGQAVYEAFVPKITVLFNDLPEELDYSDPAVTNRLAMIYLEQPLGNEFNSDTFMRLLSHGGEAFFLHIINAFKGATRADITTAEKSEFWASPFTEILETHIADGETSEFWEIEKLIKSGAINPEGKNYTTITKDILRLEFEIEARKFIKANRRNLGKALRALGYRNNTANKSWTKH